MNCKHVNIGQVMFSENIYYFTDPLIQLKNRW